MKIEKAHPDVFNILLQVLDDGRLTDGQGRTVDFKNTVIVMTSNIGSELIQGFGDDSQYKQMKASVMTELSQHFKPEFINRVDDSVVFHPLLSAQIAEIARIQLSSLASRLKERELTLNISDAALAQIAEVGFDPLFGARPLKRAIQNDIENPLAQKILAGEYESGTTVTIDTQEGVLVFK